MKIAWSNTRGHYPELLQQGESVIYTADITYDGPQPKLVNKKEVIRAKRPDCTLEAQDFRSKDSELIYTCYRSPFADVLGIDLASGKGDGLPEPPWRVQRGRRHLPGWRVRAGGIKPGTARTQSNYIDIWKLKLEAGSQDFTRITRWGEYAGYKASNPVVSPDGRRIAFQSARSKDPAGVGYGIFLLELK